MTFDYMTIIRCSEHAVLGTEMLSPCAQVILCSPARLMVTTGTPVVCTLDMGWYIFYFYCHKQKTQMSEYKCKYVYCHQIGTESKLCNSSNINNKPRTEQGTSSLCTYFLKI